ncbi:MAG: three-Cys-motif partner protein TcmP [Brevundimonas sp.]|uniref:three-Cys-motif partner protein TcmP n=1 Tax=Brevundimonas sp. TaxID=1871086 RepID=UPI00391ACFD0
MSTDHVFGNQSTDLKLDAISKYLRAYTTALRPHFNRLWYIDAFAGTGHRTIDHPSFSGNFWEESREAFREQRQGSARIALDATPRFDRLTFIDKKAGHVRALEELRTEYPDRLIDVVRGDCNDVLPLAIANERWRSTRAVMFLDPYGLTVDWSTLESIQRTKAIDVWYLVNINGILRQAARRSSSIDGHKDRRLTRMFGTSDWITEWYDMKSPQGSFLDALEQPSYQRIADEAAVELWVQQRLQKLFVWVPKPLRLYMDRGRIHQFSLFFALSNGSGPAVGLAQRLAGHVLNAGSSSHVRPR